jgi:diguanylate cyclase (GGDEF)-like protein
VIDIKTFSLVLAIGNIGFALLMAGYTRSTRHPALRTWTWSKLIVGSAYMLLWISRELEFPWMIVAATSALIVGAGLEVAAYSSFFGFSRWKRVLYPATAVALACYHAALLAGASTEIIGALISSIIIAFTGAIAFMLLRPSGESSHLRRIIGINDLLFLGAVVAHFYAAVFDTGLMSVTHGLTYIAGYLQMIGNGFGFLLLCKEKDDRQMVLLATTDSLTGLANRRAFFERADSARMLAARMRKPVALMMLDIDHFKVLNDRHGHACGDEALRVFAATSLDVLREHDIMGRLGGEEFALLLPGTDLNGAMQAAERLRHSVEQTVLPEYGFSMTVSIGVVVIDPAEHINAALARADHALYAAKSAGRNRVESAEAQLRFA